MNCILVTGATGFIGQNLVAMLRRQFPHAEVVGLGSADCDLADWEDVLRCTADRLDAFDFDQIFHLAAVYKAGDWHHHHTADAFHKNLLINANLLRWWRRQAPKARLTSVLSYCLYPAGDWPHEEPELWGTEPEDYLYAYAFAKKALLVGKRAYGEQHGLRSNSVVLPTVYGPHDRFEPDSHVVGALIGKFCRAVMEELPTVEVWGEGDQVRDFLYVDDACNGIIQSASSDAEVLNLAGEHASVKNLASRIAQITHFQGNLQFNPRQFTGVHARTLSTAKAMSCLRSWSRRFSLTEGLKKTVQWYMNETNIFTPRGESASPAGFGIRP